MKRNEKKQLDFSLSFSDLMCGIAVIFMALFLKQYNESQNSISLGNISSQIKENQVLSSGTGISMRTEGSDIVIVLDSVALFEPFSYTLKENFRLNQILPELVEIFKANAKVIDEIRIEGHTASEEGKDAVQDYLEGQLLSQQRAFNVLNYILKFVEYDDKELRSKMISVGYSNVHPVLDDNGNENQVLSRRVEIRIRIKTNSKKIYNDV